VVASLLKAGFTKVNILASQRQPDGDFANVPGHVSNPEIPKTLDLAIAEAKKTGADLVLASDPDADRIGVGLPVNGDPSGEWTTLDGNQIGAILAAFVMKQLGDLGQIRPDHYLVTTLVSTEMVRDLAKREGVGIQDNLLVGFKWIAQRIDEMGPAGFLFGFEESHGYLRGTHVRDKDAAVASLLFAELAATVKDRQQTVLEYLDDLYIDVGHYGERQVNKTLEGREGVAQIQKLMAAFRKDPLKKAGGLALTEVRDYKMHETRPISGSGATTPLPEPSGDILIFQTEAPGTRFAVRPSGTEPKIKLYLFARSSTEGVSDRVKLAEIKKQTEKQLDAIASDIEQFIKETLAAP
jgi:phosphoglucomutase/phosphomannomutase